MMDIFIIPRNDHFTLQQCQSPFIFKSVIKFIKKSIQNSMNVDSDKAGIFHLSFVQNPKLHHEKETIDTDYTTDFFLIKYIQWMNFPHPKQHFCHF